MGLKKHKKLLTILILSLTFIGITTVACKDKKVPESPKDNNQLNPNGDSELAITMREMMEFSKQLKSEIETNQQTIPYPESIKKILTARETEGMIDDRSVYDGFANYYLSTLDAVYTEGDVTEHYNTMVTSCVSCHQNYCQGPIPAIKKLYIAEK